MSSDDQIFTQLLKLIGERVEVATKKSGKKFIGKVVYTTVDSFILETEGKKLVIGFEDIEFLSEI